MRGRQDSPKHNRPFSTTPKAFGAMLLALALVILGSTTAEAGWSTPERALTASAAAGNLAVTQSGFPSLTTAYSSGALSRTVPVTVTNTGTVPAPYTLALSARSTNALTTATAVRVWTVTASGACTAGTTAAGATGKTWSTVGSFTGTLAPSAAVVYCIRSTITQAQRFALVGVASTASASLTAAIGNWTSASTATAVQTVDDTLTPGATQKTAETDSSISLAWTAPADTVAVTGYQIYRDDRLVATVPATQLTFTDSGLSAWKYYDYTVRSAHSATPVDLSPPSAGIRHATGWVNATSWYAVRNVSNQLCVAGESAGTVSGTALVSASCTSQPSQSWRFVPDGDYLKVIPKNAPSLYWDSASDNNAILRTTSNISAQKWEIVPLSPGSGTFYLRNRNNLCLDISGRTTPANNTQLRVATCTTSTNQVFTLQKTG